MSDCLKYNLYEFWDRQYVFCSNDVNHFKKVAKSKIDEYYKNDWLKCMNESSKCYLYKGYKSELALEKYLIKIGLGSVIPSSSSCVKNNGVPKNKQ